MKSKFSNNGKFFPLIAAWIILSILYVGSAKLGLQFAAIHDSVTSIWPPSGISLAAILLGGLRFLPGVTIGAFFANYLLTGVSPVVAFGIAFGNSLEAVFGYLLFRLLIKKTVVFEDAFSIFKFFVIALISSMAASIIGPVSLSVGGFADWANFNQIWWVWWLGDSIGILVITPFILVWYEKPGAASKEHIPETAMVISISLVLGFVIVFISSSFSGTMHLPLAFLSFPFLIWSSIRFGLHGATGTTFLISIIAILITAMGNGPFIRTLPHETFLILASFIGVIAVTTLSLGAMVSKNERAEKELKEFSNKLEEKVLERTEELKKSEESLLRAQEIAHLAFWERDLRTEQTVWSDEIYWITGNSPEELGPSAKDWLSSVYPDDFYVKEQFNWLNSPSKTSNLDFRIIHKDGSIRYVHVKREISYDENGKPLKTFGTCQDVTKQKMVELALRESERALSTLISNLPGHTYRCRNDTDWTMEFISEGVFELTGYRSEDFIHNKNVKFGDIIHPEDQKRVWDEVQNALKENRSFELNYRIINASGEERWVWEQGRMVSTLGESPEMLEGIVHDITERKQAEESIREKVRLIQLLQDISVAANEATTVRDVMVTCLEKVCTHTGWEVGHVYVPNSEGILHPSDMWYISDPPQFKTIREVTQSTTFKPGVGLPGRVFESGKPVWIRDLRKDPNFPRARMVKDLGVDSGFAFPVLEGKQVVSVLEFFTRGITDPDEALLEAIGHLATQLGRVTERKRAEEEKENLRDQLVQMEKLSSLGTFVSGIAHELNNPLTAVLAFSELLLDSDLKDKEDIREVLNTICKEAIRTAGIVNNLLLFSRNSTAEKQLLKVDHDLKFAIKLLEYQFKTDNIFIETDLASDLPQVSGNSNQLQQVFINIMSNAKQSMLQANGKGTLKIRTSFKDQSIFIELKNDGPPIPEEDMTRIFDPFFTTKDVGQGTGLGLSIAYGIISDHNGGLFIENLPDEKGVRFTIELPVEKSEKKYSPIRQDRIEVNNLGIGRKVLVIDDEESILSLLRRILEKEQFQVECVVSGNAALESVQKNSFDLIFCDVKMPGMDGMELYGKMTERFQELSSRFILVTGDINLEIESFCESNGIQYIRKPFRSPQILSLIHNILDSAT